MREHKSNNGDTDSWT